MQFCEPSFAFSEQETNALLFLKVARDERAKLHSVVTTVFVVLLNILAFARKSEGSRGCETTKARER